MQSKLFLSIAFVWLGRLSSAQNVIVDVNLNVNHKVDTVTTFHRSKFVAMHADVLEPEWDTGWGANFKSDIRDDFLEQYDVYLGRNTGPITGELNQTSEDPNRLGYADNNNIAQRGTNFKNWYAGNTSWHQYENRNNLILAAQLFPFWPDGTKTATTGWALSQEDTQETPFGTASGEYMANFLAQYFGTGGVTGQPKPKLVEIINEPLYHISDFGKVFKYHNTVASEIKALNPDVLVGGYCTAFPDFEKNNFDRWEKRWKRFIDDSGENMDFWSIHLYDFPTFGGKELYRKGSNMEATFDMIDHYSELKFGKRKPYVVSEFGASVHDYQGAWSPYRDWLHLKSVNSMMMQFMERPNIIYQTANFLIIKATWGTVDQNQTYPHRLMRRENEPNSYTGDWVYTDMVKTYQLWKNVKGKRVDTWATDPDILVDAYVDGSKAYVIINNLSFESKKVKPKLIEDNDLSISGVTTREMYLDNTESIIDRNSPVLNVKSHILDFPTEVTLKPEATTILEYTFSGKIEIGELSDEKKYYADKYYQSIEQNQDNSFEIDGVTKGSFGEATLRLGIGRAHGKSLIPTLQINGSTVEVPENFRGGTQDERDSFFGVIEVNVPYSLIESNNEVKVSFNDGGGFISSVALQTYEFSKEIARSEPEEEEAIINSLGSMRDFRLFPNPAQDRIHIKSKFSFEKANFFNISGRLHSTLSIHSDSINTSQIESGLYLVELISADKTIRKKIIIKH